MGLARARHDLEVQSRAFARSRRAHERGCAGRPRCLMCLGGAMPHTRSCGDARAGARPGGAHAACLAKYAEVALAPPPGAPTFKRWLFLTCKRQFTGQVQMQLAVALWANSSTRTRRTNQEHPRRQAYTPRRSAVAGEHAEGPRGCNRGPWTSSFGRWGSSTPRH